MNRHGLTKDRLKLYEPNPRYLDYRGKPIVLIGSTEHYGSVINRDFDYLKYLDTMQACGLNVTRLFSGQYRERPGKFGIDPAIAPDIEIFRNTLAPQADSYIAPWQRSSVPGAADGGNKFDLRRWNDEYFARLVDFVEKAEARGIIVEFSFFSPYYANFVGQRFWEISPWHDRNNINSIGVTDGAEALSLKHPELVRVQEELIREVVSHLKDVGNVYFEICNEPFAGHVPLSWQAYIASVIKAAGRSVGREFLVMQEFSDVANTDMLQTIKEPTYRNAFLESGVESRLPDVSLWAFHNPLPRTLVQTGEFGLPCGQNESCGLATDASNRISAWRVILSGGAFHHGTDYSFTVGHEDGSFLLPPGSWGGGSPALRYQLGLLARFVEDLDFPRMRPLSVVASAMPKGICADALGNAGVNYAIYFSEQVAATSKAREQSRGGGFAIKLDIPAGPYTGKWIEPKSGAVLSSLEIPDSNTEIAVPTFREDIALRLDRVR